jgi:hypothetical protein
MDLLSDLAIPDITSAQLAPVKPDLDAGRAERLGNVSCGPTRRITRIAALDQPFDRARPARYTIAPPKSMPVRKPKRGYPVT